MTDECTIIIHINYTGSQEQIVRNDKNTEEFNDFPLLCKLLSCNDMTFFSKYDS